MGSVHDSNTLKWQITHWCNTPPLHTISIVSGWVCLYCLCSH